jgi:very-short-patch-repair endonuclease
MKSKKMKPLRWATNAEQSAYMREMQAKNRRRSASNPNELWMADKLDETGLKWTPQAVWGYRIFDFWCHQLGIAVEVDGPEHRIEYDNYRDEYNYRRSAVLVLRVRNRSEEDAAAALRVIAESESWNDRRARLGIDGKSKKIRRSLVSGQHSLELAL